MIIMKQFSSAESIIIEFFASKGYGRKRVLANAAGEFSMMLKNVPLSGRICMLLPAAA
jgi:hypothetical protein